MPAYVFIKAPTLLESLPESVQPTFIGVCAVILADNSSGLIATDLLVAQSVRSVERAAEDPFVVVDIILITVIAGALEGAIQ